ncbi:reverse transcriptase domain-containing protein [Tanacetum coccineum]
MSQSNQQVNVVNPSCETCGGPHQHFECQAAGGFTQGDVYATTGSYNAGGNSYQPQGNRNLLSYRSNNFLGPPGFNQPNNPANQMTKMEKAFNERPQGAPPSNIIPNPREDLKVITTWSGITLAGPSVPPPSPSFSKEMERDPKTIMDQVHISSPENTARVLSPVVQPAPVSKPNEIPERNPHQPHIPYPSRLNKEKLQDKSDIQIHKFLQMFKKLHFNISFAEALAQMPKYAKMLKDLLTNMEKLLELANTPLNENFLAVLLRKLPEKLGDLGKFLIPCDFSELEECMALADLGASINLMPLFVWKILMLPELVPTCMTLDLANRSVAYLAGIAEDVFVQVGRPFLRTARALADVYGEELTLRFGDEKLIFNVESISKYPRKHGDESINKIDILDTTCQDYFHDVLNVQQSIHPLNDSPTPSSEPMVEYLSPSLTPFGDCDFLLEETDAFLSLDDSIPPGNKNGIYDLEGDILFLEELLNDDPTNDLPPLKDLKNDEIKTTKSLIEDPLELELKDLPPHLEYAFLEGIDPNFCTHKILMEDDFKPVVQHQRRVNPKINEVIKAEVIKLLDAGLIYPISDSPWDA